MAKLIDLDGLALAVNRIKAWVTELVTSKIGDAIDDIEQTITDSDLPYNRAVVPLKSMTGYNAEGFIFNPSAGDMWYDGTNIKWWETGTSGGVSVAKHTDVVYLHTNTRKMYRWNGNTMQPLNAGDIPTKTSELTNDSGFISADDAQLIEYKEYDDPADEWTDKPSVPTIGYYVGPMATDVGFWDGGLWNMFPTSDAIYVTIDAKLNRRINWVSSVGNHNQANSPLNLDCNDTHVIMNGVANSGDSTLYIQCSGIAGAGQQSECIIYFDCTSAAKSINWKNTISWVNDAPAFESGKIYEVSLCKIGDKWLGVYTEYASSVAMSNNLN